MFWLQVILIALKITGVVWWWVLSPTWIFAGVYVVVMAVTAICAFIYCRFL